jgi:hypothetical protein
MYFGLILVLAARFIKRMFVFESDFADYSIQLLFFKLQADQLFSSTNIVLVSAFPLKWLIPSGIHSSFFSCFNDFVFLLG